MSLCECGCGHEAPRASRSAPALGLRRGDSQRFVRGHSARQRRPSRYPRVANGGAPRYVHRVRAESALGRPLPDRAEVHHVDELTSPTSRLVICQDAAYHDLLHARARVVRLGGDPNTQRWCVGCQALQPITAFGKRSVHRDGLNRRCRPCQNVLVRKQYWKQKDTGA